MTSISALSNWQPVGPRPAASAVSANSANSANTASSANLANSSTAAANSASNRAAPSTVVRLSTAGLAAARQGEAQAADESALPPTTAMRFKDLGAAMLGQFRSGAAIPVEQAALPDSVDNKFNLSITTRSGVKVDLTLASLDDGMALQLSASGELSDAEQSALSGLAAGFQAAIDGMALDDPQIRLGGLAAFDSSVLQSVDFHAAVKQSTLPPSTQTLAFRADGAQRKVSIAGAAGKAEVSIDTSKLESLGTREQQNKAISSYLKQFDQATARGHGDAKLMTMFKDAFSDLSRTATREADQERGLALPGNRWTLAPEDHAALTGLADFSASVTQATGWSNPLRLGEKDSFSYEVSQATRVDGERRDDRTIAQSQQSQLNAQFHQALNKDAALKLDFAPQSQNYEYHTINDQASSNVELGYKDGKLVKASLLQTASQSDHMLKYVMGKLAADRTTPSSHTLARDLMASLALYQSGAPARSADETSTAREERRAQGLSAVSDNIFLLGTPSELAARDKL